jgi:CheY-like chemotaxis protein
VLPDVFTMFTQAHTSLDRAQAGLGVGLALSRHLVEMHGGTITAESGGMGRGSRFTVHLPLAEIAVSHTQASAASHGATASGHRVLVVDDNHDFATSLAMILRDMGNDVRVEHDGIDGLRGAEAFQPDVAFLDIGLPGISGYELARRLRENRAYAAMVLVAVTGWAQARDKARATQAGFDYHLVKPLDPQHLTAILQALDRKEPASRLEISISGA